MAASTDTPAILAGYLAVALADAERYKLEAESALADAERFKLEAESATQRAISAESVLHYMSNQTSKSSPWPGMECLINSEKRVVKLEQQLASVIDTVCAIWRNEDHFVEQRRRIAEEFTTARAAINPVTQAAAPPQAPTQWQLSNYSLCLTNTAREQVAGQLGEEGVRLRLFSRYLIVNPTY
jgi:hypothetical protein